MPALRLRSYLDSQQIRYTSLIHSGAYTMQEVASVTHIPGRDIAKTVILFADDRLVLAVVPASKQVSLTHMKEVLGASNLILATESEFLAAFPDCEVGAMPPFGNLYGMKTYLDETLIGHEMLFNAGNHRELIRMSWDDYFRLAQPQVVSIAQYASHAEARQG